MRPLSKPHPKFRTDLNEKDRESKWAEAAGEGKSIAQHYNFRDNFTRKANEDVAEAKNGIRLTTKDNEVLKKKQDRLSKHAACNRARLGKP